MHNTATSASQGEEQLTHRHKRDCRWSKGPADARAGSGYNFHQLHHRIRAGIWTTAPVCLFQQQLVTMPGQRLVEVLDVEIAGTVGDVPAQA